MPCDALDLPRWGFDVEGDGLCQVHRGGTRCMDASFCGSVHLNMGRKLANAHGHAYHGGWVNVHRWSVSIHLDCSHDVTLAVLYFYVVCVCSGLCSSALCIPWYWVF